MLTIKLAETEEEMKQIEAVWDSNSLRGLQCEGSWHCDIESYTVIQIPLIHIPNIQKNLRCESSEAERMSELHLSHNRIGALEARNLIRASCRRIPSESQSQSQESQAEWWGMFFQYIQYFKRLFLCFCLICFKKILDKKSCFYLFGRLKKGTIRLLLPNMKGGNYGRPDNEQLHMTWADIGSEKHEKTCWQIWQILRQEMCNTDSTCTGDVPKKWVIEEVDHGQNGVGPLSPKPQAICLVHIDIWRTADCKLSSFHASSFSEHLQKHSKHSNVPNESGSETHGAKKNPLL